MSLLSYLVDHVHRAFDTYLIRLFHKIVTTLGWGVDFDGEHGVYAVYHSKQSLFGR